MTLLVKDRSSSIARRIPAFLNTPKRRGLVFRVPARLVVVARNGDLVEVCASRTTSLTRSATGCERERFHGRHLKLTYIGLGLLGANFLWAGSMWVLGCSGIVIYGALPFFKKAERKFSKRARPSGELVLSFVTLLSLALGQFLGAVVANWFYHLREWVAAKTERQSRAEILGVVESLAGEAWVLEDGQERLIPITDLRVDQVVVVRSGDVIPVDGEVTDGFAMVDQQILTGESRLKEVSLGDAVVASVVVVTGRLFVKAKRTGRNMLVSQVDSVFARTQHYVTAHAQSRGERFSDLLAYPALGLGAVVGLGGGALRGLSMLNSWPVCGLVIVASTSMLSHLRLAARRGFFVRDARVFEQFLKVDTVIFDKTGTLTESQFRICRVTMQRGFEDDHVLSLAAAAERPFRHPLAKAIVREAQQRKLQVPENAEGNMEIGFGVAMRVSGVAVHIGSERFMRLERIAVPDELRSALGAAIEAGNTGLLVAIDRKVAASFELASLVRPDADRSIQALRRLGIRHIGLLSGDHPSPTKRIATSLGLDSWAAEQLPEQKADYIKALQREGRTVCFVGDGVNDAIALKHANVSISMNQAAGAAQESADVVLSELSVEKLSALAGLSRAYERNVFRSFAVNGGVLVVSLLGVTFLGFGYFSSIIISNFGVGLGVLSASLPLMEKGQKPSHVAAGRRDRELEKTSPLGS